MEAKLKDKKYYGLLSLFYIFSISLFYISLSSDNLNLKEFNSIFAKFNNKDSLIMLLSPIVILILQGLIPTKLKNILVFWRLRDVLPAHRAFSKLIDKDPRIDNESLRTNMGGVFPEEPMQQNTSWFRLSLKHKNDPRIHSSHGSFLLTRDLCSMSFIFMITSILTLSPMYIIYTFLQYIIFSLASRNYANQFVLNVLAVESCYKPDQLAEA